MFGKQKQNFVFFWMFRFDLISMWLFLEYKLLQAVARIPCDSKVSCFFLIKKLS